MFQQFSVASVAILVVTSAVWADEPKIVLRLPEQAGAQALDGGVRELLYLNISAKGALILPGQTPIGGATAEKIVREKFEALGRIARKPVELVVRADRDAPALEIVRLIKASGSGTAELRVLKPATADVEMRLVFACGRGEAEKAVKLSVKTSKEGAKVEITEPGGKAEEVALDKLAGRLKTSLGKQTDLALEVNRVCPWSNVVAVLAACREGGVKTLILVK